MNVSKWHMEKWKSAEFISQIISLSYSPHQLQRHLQFLHICQADVFFFWFSFTSFNLSTFKDKQLFMWAKWTHIPDWGNLFSLYNRDFCFSVLIITSKFWLASVLIDIWMQGMLWLYAWKCYMFISTIQEGLYYRGIRMHLSII